MILIMRSKPGREPLSKEEIARLTALLGTRREQLLEARKWERRLDNILVGTVALCFALLVICLIIGTPR
jgi:hypothetical protein